MNFTQSFKLALKSLRTSKMRSFLTMLGIIIGVGAVIIIISLGNGLKSMVDQQVERASPRSTPIPGAWVTAPPAMCLPRRCTKWWRAVRTFLRASPPG